MIIGDREFHSVKLADWLKKKAKKQKVFFAFRQKQGTNFKKGRSDYQAFSDLGISPGMKLFWFILTNLDSLELVLKVYRARMGIEAMFKDCKTGGYNLEGSKANNQRLTSLILLIAIAYTNTALKGKFIKKTGQAEYIARLQEKRRIQRRHSNFWIGLYGAIWVEAWEYCQVNVQLMMNNNPQKFVYYQRGLKAMSLIEDSF